MRLLANEIFPATPLPYSTMQTTMSSGCARTRRAVAMKISARARTEKRVLITFDQDFGELAFRAKRPADCGIILFQIAIRSSTFFAQLTVNTIDSRAD